MPFDTSTIARTATRAQTYPETVRRELMAVLIAKSMIAARNLLGAVAANTDFEALRTAKYTKGRSLEQQVAWHSDALDRLEAATGRVSSRLEEVRSLIAGDEALLLDLEEATLLCDAACALARSLQTAWGHERARRLAAEELRDLRLSTALEAIRPLLADAA